MEVVRKRKIKGGNYYLVLVLDTLIYDNFNENLNLFSKIVFSNQIP